MHTHTVAEEIKPKWGEKRGRKKGEEGGEKRENSWISTEEKIAKYFSDLCWKKRKGDADIFFLLHHSFFSFIALYRLPSLGSLLSPLQFVDLFLLVILFIFSLPQDLEKPFHLGLRLPSILFVLGHFLLQAGYASGEFSAGLGICCCTLSLEQKLVIINKQSVSF